MALTIDFDAISSPTELATAANTFTEQLSGEVVSLQDSLDPLTETVVSNCDIFGSIGDLVAGATADFSKAVTENLAKFQKAAGELMKDVGDYIKKLKSKISDLKDSIKKMFSGISIPSFELLAKAKKFFNDLKTKLSSVFVGIKTSIVNLITASKDLMSKFAKDLKAVLSRGCSVATDALKSIGKGSGIDAVVDGAIGSIDGAMAGVKDSVQAAATTTLTSITGIMDNVKSSFDSLNTSFA